VVGINFISILQQIPFNFVLLNIVQFVVILLLGHQAADLIVETEQWGVWRASPPDVGMKNI